MGGLVFGVILTDGRNLRCPILLRIDTSKGTDWSILTVPRVPTQHQWLHVKFVDVPAASCKSFSED